MSHPDKLTLARKSVLAVKAFQGMQIYQQIQEATTVDELTSLLGSVELPESTEALAISSLVGIIHLYNPNYLPELLNFLSRQSTVLAPSHEHLVEMAIRQGDTPRALDLANMDISQARRFQPDIRAKIAYWMRGIDNWELNQA
jgi:hypothetical protein